jgi:hypothetical protein
MGTAGDGSGQSAVQQAQGAWHTDPQTGGQPLKTFSAGDATPGRNGEESTRRTA